MEKLLIVFIFLISRINTDEIHTACKGKTNYNHKNHNEIDKETGNIDANEFDTLKHSATGDAVVMEADNAIETKENQLDIDDNLDTGTCQRTADSGDAAICDEGDNTDAEDDGVDFKEYPKLTMIETGNVGDVREISFEPGKVHKRITTLLDPPLFEIPDFFSSSECEYLINLAKKKGLSTSGVFGADINDEFEAKQDLSDIQRVSQNTWLWKKDMKLEMWLKLRKRLAKLTHLPLGAIKRSESIQIASYGVGGHFHAHVDSTANYELPCCFQTDCKSYANTVRWNTCCRQCRYITVMVYLNDVEEGGETAFPFANMDEPTINRTIAEEEKNSWYNLSKQCHAAPVRVLPEKGKAVFWYNHGVDDKGYLGKLLIKSFHGGCDVIKGSKWIANFWIGWPSYESRFDKSIYSTEV